MKSKILILLSFILISSFAEAQLIQGSIQKGSGNSVDVWLKPNFSNSTEYLAQIGLPIAFPASEDISLSDLTVTLDANFVTNFGNNYSVSIYPLANNTGNTVEYFMISLVRGGSGASSAQSWTSGTAFKVLNVSLAYSGSVDTAKIKVADFQDGGSDLQGYFYTADGHANYYITSNSVNNFYAISGQSTTGGNSSEGYAETLDSVVVSTFRAPVTHPVLAEDIKPATATVFPNPASHSVKISFNATAKENVALIITDLNGKRVSQTNVLTQKGENQFTVNIEKLSKGSYIVKALCKSACTTIVQKFVKQ